jgi:dipeptidyl aminopeptidase/acylaminoacyl peptidase
LERIARRCLEKIPGQRFQSAKDLSFALENLSAGISRPQRVLREPTNRWRNVSLVAIAATLTALAVGAHKFLAPYEQPSYHQITFRKGYIPGARFAPGGQSVIYSAAWDHPPIKLYSSRLDGSETRRLDLPSGELFAVSSTGELAMDLGGNTWRGTGGARLASVPLSGGAPRELLDNIGVADWSPDGARLAVAKFENGKCRLEYPVGTVLYETLGYISNVRFSPQGDSLAFMDHPQLADDRGSVVLVDLKGNKHFLTSEWAGEQGLAWSADGKEIWFTATDGSDVRTLYAVSRSGKQRVVLRIPGSVELDDIAADGRVLLTRLERRFEVAVSQIGGGSRQLSWLEIMSALSVSHDSKSAVIADWGSRREYDVYLAPLDGSPPVLLGLGGGGSISPDSKWVTSIVPNDTTKVLLLPTGVGETKIITAPDFHYSGAFWASDGRSLVVIGSQSGRAVRAWTQTLDGGPPRPVTEEGTDGLFVTVNHADYICVRDSKKTEVLLYPINGGDPRTIRGLNGTEEVVGGAPESENLYVSPDVSAVPLQIFKVNIKSGLRQPLVNISPTDPAGVVRIISPIITTDEKRYVSTHIRALSVLYVASGLK